MDELTDYIEEIKKLYNERSNITEEINNRIKTLQNMIKDGATTGNKITDFVICAYGAISEEIERPYKMLDNLLKDNIGKELLMIWNKEEIVGFPTFGPNKTEIIPSRYIGIIKSGIEFEQLHGFYYVIIPMDKHVHDDNYKKEWELAKSPIKIKCIYFKMLDKMPTTEMGQYFCVGNEIKAPEYAKALKLLGINAY